MHKNLKSFSSIPLFFFRILIDTKRAIKHWDQFELNFVSFFALLVGAVWVRLIYSAGVIAGYSKNMD